MIVTQGVSSGVNSYSSNLEELSSEKEEGGDENKQALSLSLVLQMVENLAQDSQTKKVSTNNHTDLQGKHEKQEGLLSKDSDSVRSIFEEAGTDLSGTSKENTRQFSDTMNKLMSDANDLMRTIVDRERTY